MSSNERTYNVVVRLTGYEHAMLKEMSFKTKASMARIATIATLALLDYEQSFEHGLAIARLRLDDTQTM